MFSMYITASLLVYLHSVTHLHGVFDEPLALVHGQPDVPAAVVDGFRHAAEN